MVIVVVVLSVIAVFGIAAIIGKMKGTSDPSTMTEAAIKRRIIAETHWVNGYLRQSISSHTVTRKTIFDEKTAYVTRLKAELERRNLAAAPRSAAVEPKLAGVSVHPSESIAKDSRQRESKETAVVEWNDKGGVAVDVIA